MNFYEKIHDQQLCNCIYILSYITEYICFMKVSDKSPMLYLTNNNIDYLVVNKLLAEDIILTLSNMSYQSKTIWYILFTILKKHFEKVMYN